MGKSLCVLCLWFTFKSGQLIDSFLYERFLRHVPVVYVDYPGKLSLTQIYGTFNRAMLRLVPSLKPYAEPLTAAMVEFFLMSQVQYQKKKEEKPVIYERIFMFKCTSHIYFLTFLGEIYPRYAAPLHLQSSWNDSLGERYMWGTATFGNTSNWGISQNLGSWST